MVYNQLTFTFPTNREGDYKKFVELMRLNNNSKIQTFCEAINAALLLRKSGWTRKRLEKFLPRWKAIKTKADNIKDEIMLEILEDEIDFQNRSDGLPTAIVE
jgi:hypothetical protein